MINEKIKENLKPLVMDICKDKGVDILEVEIIIYYESSVFEIKFYNPISLDLYCCIDIIFNIHHELPANLVGVDSYTISEELRNQFLEQELDSCIAIREEYKSLHYEKSAFKTIKIIYDIDKTEEE